MCFIVFESQEFLRAWENNNFMAKNCSSVHVHEINVYIFLLLAEFKLLLPAIDFDCPDWTAWTLTFLVSA